MNKQKTSYKFNQLEDLHNIFIDDKYILSIKDQYYANLFVMTINKNEYVTISIKDKLFDNKLFYFTSKNIEKLNNFIDNITNHEYFHNPQIYFGSIETQDKFDIDKSFWGIKNYFSGSN